MTALSEALTAAQARALSALQKAYVAGLFEADSFHENCATIGLTDEVDRGYLVHCLDVLRELGSEVPAETNGKPKDEPMTEKQGEFILKLCREKDATPPDTPLTKAQAHEIIDTLQSGTYDPAKWKLPF